MEDMQALSDPCRTVRLGEALEVRFYDQGNRYYGDYHRIRVLVRIDVLLQEAHFRDEPDPAQGFSSARRWFGESVVFEKVLERMGVSGADVDKVRSDLIDNYLETAGSYLAHPDFPRRFVLQQLQERQSRPAQVPGF